MYRGHDDDDGGEERHESDQIALEDVRGALRVLGVEWDEEVMNVFRNAASGWAGEGPKDGALGVSLEDWRSVCSVLLEDEEEDKEEFAGGGFLLEDDDEEEEEEDDGEDSDEFVPEDEFGGAGRSRRARTTRKDASASDADDDDDDQPKSLTSAQEQSARDTFGLFFPDTPTEDLLKKRIMIKDIQRVAGLLKEKIKPEEIMDMLEMFSNSPDKTMGYQDFVRMLVAAGLV